MPPTADSASARGLPDWARWLLALLPVRILLAAIAPVLPEEAYHWNFARHLDWSYLDHPPMIAWAIAVGRLVAGDTPFGIRLVPLVFSVGSSIVLARFTRRLYGEVAAVWAILLFTLSPIPLVVSEAGFPDSPLLFFWSLTLALSWEAVESGSPRAWLAAGASLGGAMLSKYTAVLLVPSLFLYLPTPCRQRQVEEERGRDAVQIHRRAPRALALPLPGAVGKGSPPAGQPLAVRGGGRRPAGLPAGPLLELDAWVGVLPLSEQGAAG